MLKECPICKSKNITMVKTTDINSNCFALLSVAPETKTIHQEEALQLNAYVCNDCHFVALFAPFDNQSDDH